MVTAKVYSFMGVLESSKLRIPAAGSQGVEKRKEPMTDARKKNPYEEITGVELPQPGGYRVIEPTPEVSDGLSVEPEPIVFPVAPPLAEVKLPAAKASLPQPFLNPVWKERLLKFVQNPVRVYAAAGIGLGILFGVIIAVLVWHSESSTGRYDLGSFTASATGLKGHLFVEWDKRVRYRLTIAPEEADRQAGFALAVSSSPQPLAIHVHLQDAEGFVLCSKDVLLKFDARSAAALTATAPATPAPGSEVATLPADQSAQTTDFARLDAQETAREQGQDLFQNQTGADGMISAIAAQGEIPCSKSAYEKAMTWSFTPDFPSLAEQDALLKRQADLLLPPPPPLPTAATHKKRPTLKALPFTVEGDDAIVEFDPSFGVIETRGRKLFFLDKAAAAAANSAWQDYPVSIHYHCDPMSNCTLMHSGLGALRVRMRR
jgi:hypothetical protein